MQGYGLSFFVALSTVAVDAPRNSKVSLITAVILYSSLHVVVVARKHTSQLTVEWQLQAGHRSLNDVSSDGT